MTDDDIRLAHKEISLPDTADAFLRVITLARSARLVPRLAHDPHSSVVMAFIRHH